MHDRNPPFYMSVFHTTLPGFVLTDLFKTSLIDQPGDSNGSEQAAKEAVIEALISYVGKNQHFITIGVYFAEQPAVPADSLQFLASILKACQRSLDHVAVVNFAARELQLAEIISQLQPAIMMLFGPYHVFGSWMVETEEFSPFYLQKIQVIRAPALDVMLANTAESRALKSKLWMMLKQLFNL